MSGNPLRLVDSDTGESVLDVVRVPEGWSLQVYDLSDELEYRSVILDVDQVRQLQAHFLATEAAR